MFLLLSRIPSGLDPLRERFEAHVKKAGIDSVERAVGSSSATTTTTTNGDAAGAGANGGGSKDRGEKKDVAVEPKAYVESLLVVHRKNNELVGKAFRGDQGFVASLDRVSLPLSFLSLSLS